MSSRELDTPQAEDMAEPEVATKAPENDAAEQSVFPNDTRAQEGASMGVGRLPGLRATSDLGIL